MAAKKSASAAAGSASAISQARAAVDAKTLAKIDKLAKEAIATVKKKDNPNMAIRTRALSNVSFNEKKRIIELGDKMQSREFFNTGMARKYMQTFLVAKACKELIEDNKTITIRQLYYVTKHTIRGTQENTFEDQSESDPIIEDLEVTIDALREELHLFANKKGLAAGPVVVDDSGDEIDLSRMGRGGWGIPSICEAEVLKFKKSTAKFAILVEKDAVWSRLLEDRFHEKNNCLLISSGGQAARGVRRFVQRIATELKIPIYILVDNDPWGLYIYSVLKQGSINLAFESMRMAVPNVRFIGMSAFDYKKFKLPNAVEIKLNKEDIARAAQMRAYPWFAGKQWQKEIDELVHNGFKMEVDSILSKGISFITDEYLPKKIRDNDYLV
jgi:DNA topoisomerase VI subunit A